MSLFEEGIRPVWEDEKNKKGKILTLDYIIEKDIQEFLKIIPGEWKKLMLSILGEVYDFAPFVNKSYIKYF
ncbi:MAG: eukaryotic translation initiation factor EIF4E family protein [archaeon]|nr:eukaryotic translation initiation factor EIF4E family protein [archaeon]